MSSGFAQREAPALFTSRVMRLGSRVTRRAYCRCHGWTQDLLLGLVPAVFFFGAKKLPEIANVLDRASKEFEKCLAGTTESPNERPFAVSMMSVRPGVSTLVAVHTEDLGLRQRDSFACWRDPTKQPRCVSKSRRIRVGERRALGVAS
jgi:hypothetical protein